ncbi:MAG TPA: YciI family protein [Candidatus Stackebrandtia excrementipullorum]|nr:YciI family protein [Candidatus Stackebrandtia excrementipullorum]
MFLVELRFGPEPERLALRPAHRGLLTRWYADGLVQAAGPFDDGSGSLVLFTVDDEQRLDELLKKDPYYSAPGVTVVRKQRWSPLPLAE